MYSHRICDQGRLTLDTLQLDVCPLWPLDLETLRFLLLRLKPNRSSLREYMMLHPASYGFSMNALGMTGAKRHEMILVSLTGGLVQGFSG